MRRFTPSGNGPFKFTVNEMEFSIFPKGKTGDNTDTIETLKRNNANKDTVEVHYHVETSASKDGSRQFVNNMADAVFTLQPDKKEQLPGD